MSTINNPKQLFLDLNDVMKALEDAFRKKYPDIFRDNEFEIMLPYNECYYSNVEANVIEAAPPSVQNTKPTHQAYTAHRAYINNYEAVFGKSK
jgi:hypothetical protein